MILLFISKEILVCYCICHPCVVQIKSQVCHATVYTFKVLVPSFIYTKYISIERNTLNVISQWLYQFHLINQCLALLEIVTGLIS